MILIADSGSTKTNWIGIKDKKIVFKTNSAGMNPSVFSKEILENTLKSNPNLVLHKDTIKQIYFYGAGCGTVTPKEKLASILSDFFEHSTIEIYEDSVAAIRSVTNQASIVCILGTGSNCTLFDGKKSIQKIASLGYSVMDDASGNYFGRILLRDYFYHKMPLEIAEKFEKSYNLNPDEIKQHLYNKDNPNTYLASFSRFLIDNKSVKYSQNIIKNGIILFIENQILQFKESSYLPIHFIGSIAYFLQDEIKQIAKEYSLNIGVFERHPINGLINYHLKK